MSWRVPLGASALTIMIASGCGREAPPPPEPVGETPPSMDSPVTPPAAAPDPKREPALPADRPPATAPSAAPAPSDAPVPGSVALPGLMFRPDPAWRAGSPAPMRAAQFELPGSDGAAATLVVYYFGQGGAGTGDANLVRWANQFEVPAGGDPFAAATLGEREIDGMPVRTMDLAGTYVAAMTPGSQARVRELNWRLLAAIVETEAGPYYFKLVGPAAAVTQWEEAYEATLASMQRGPVDATGGPTNPQSGGTP